MIAWLGSVFLVDRVASDSGLDAWAAFAITVAAGAAIGHWPLLLVPVALAALLAIAGAISYNASCGSTCEDISYGEFVVLAVLFAALADIGLAVGIGLRRLVTAVV